MITEDYCSYEVARLLKEKGFDVGVGGMYVDKDNNFVHASLAPLKVKDYEKVFDDQFIPTCTHQMAMKWLREKGIVIQISPILQDQPFGLHYRPSVQDYQRYMRHDNFDEFNTYEEAVDAALKHALENLI